MVSYHVHELPIKVLFVLFSHHFTKTQMSFATFYSYIRVSTVKQGQSGTSLDEQRAAIRAYAERNRLEIVKEFEEKETAAKLGRPVFDLMLEGLKQGKVRGVIIHKIDRGARNLKDWANLGELIDRGIEVHFANESLDLQSRGGRLSADIQAVVASDYIRNLREETKKGFYGRIKQGVYPRPAPLGYLNVGQGKPKAIDPDRAPFIKQLFELYATGQWPLKPLVERMHELGLRSKKGTKVKLHGISNILHNPFYTGTIYIKVRGELFAGAHPALITQQLFDRVQQVLAGKNVEKRLQHLMLFRKLIRCGSCGITCIGEKQKGYTYYRCHNQSCPQKTIREEIVEEAFACILSRLRFTEQENHYLCRQIKVQYGNFLQLKDAQAQALRIQLGQVQSRLANLTDAYIDGMLDKEAYLQRKNQLVTSEKEIKEKQNRLDTDQMSVMQKIEQFLELVNNAYASYKLANEVEKRELVKIVTSNLTVNGKTVSFKLNLPFQAVTDRQNLPDGGAQPSTARTLDALLSQLNNYFKDHDLTPLPDQPTKKYKLPLDQAILVGARKITNQSHLYKD